MRLLEEPQAAFYDWLDRHEEDIDELVRQMHLALVVDIGGGTTDLTLIQVELRESGPRLTRVAVGDHLMLGGDNMDLALAHDVEARLGEKGNLGASPTTAASAPTCSAPSSARLRAHCAGGPSASSA